MDAKTVAKLQTRLEHKKGQLAEAIANRGEADTGHRLKGEFESRFPSYGNKDEENATEVAEYQDTLSTEESLEGSLEKVSAALERIKKGTYGMCRTCGKEISRERLNAYPEADVCVQC